MLVALMEVKLDLNLVALSVAIEAVWSAARKDFLTVVVKADKLES